MFIVTLSITVKLIRTPFGLSLSKPASSGQALLELSLILVLMLLPGCVWAEITHEKQIGSEIAKELNYLLSFVGPNQASAASFKPEKIATVLQFVRRSKEQGVLYYPDAVDGTPSAYFEVDVARPLSQILRLTDNDGVPAVFTAPSSIRSAHWKRVDTPDHQRPKFWEAQAPVFLTGVEHLVNTPDQTTGAYYEYDLDRTVILTQVDGKNLFISLSKQKGISSAGKKGLIIGQDGQWDYLYTGQQGLNRFGLGWVDSYMYDSYSVTFYLEDNTGSPGIRFGAFKWLKAGWSDINFVKRSHIYEGLQRYSDVLKQIAENPRMADTESWSNTLADIQKLKVNQLHEYSKQYLDSLEKQLENEDALSAEELKSLFKGGAYLRSLIREDMQAIVVLEYLKQLLGKPTRINLRQIIAKE